MTKIHVVDTHIDVNEVLEYESEKEIDILKIKDYRNMEYLDTGGEILKMVVLENGVQLTYLDNGFECFTDQNGNVYAPVYDVETCEIEEYSIYEEDDIIGFVNRGYKYSDFC